MILYNIDTGKEVLYFKREDKIFDTLNLGLHTNKETGKLVYVKGVKYDCDDVVYELYNISYDEVPYGDRYYYVSSLIETINQPEFFKNYKSVDLKDMILKENNMKDKKFEVYININTGEKRYVDRNTVDCKGEYSVYDNDNKLIYHISEIDLKKDFIKYDNSFKKYITDAKVVEAKPMKARYYPNNATIKDLDKDGYCIIYWNDYVVWMEKDKFEEIYTLYDLDKELSFNIYIDGNGHTCKAKPMKAKDFPNINIKNKEKDGYYYKYDDGLIGWMEKDKFEEIFTLMENNMEDKNNYEAYINCMTAEKRYVDKNTTDCRGEYPVYDDDNKLIYHVSESDLENEYIKYDDSFITFMNFAGFKIEAKPMKGKDFPGSDDEDYDKNGYCIYDHSYYNSITWMNTVDFERAFRFFKAVPKVPESSIKNTEECSCGKSCVCNKEETEDQQLHQSILDEIHKLYISKNKDYGNSFSKLFKEFDLLGTDYMLTTKMNRFKQLSKGQVPNNESIRDTLMDLANYAILTIMELDSKED